MTESREEGSNDRYGNVERLGRPADETNESDSCPDASSISFIFAKP